MPESSSFTVDVYPESAFMISYKDSCGTLLFNIEPVSNDLIYLNAHASTGKEITDEMTEKSDRYRTAVDRVAAYLGKGGAKVVVEK